MNRIKVLGILLIAVSSLMLLGFVSQQNGAIDRKQLREMLVQLGYEVRDISKDAGKEKYEVTFKTDGFNVPIGYEISPSLNYIWLTVNLGDAPKSGNDKTLQLLKQNGKIQPSFFYITDSGRLMMAIAVENRGLTNAILKARSEAVSENVEKTSKVWQDQ